MSMRDMVTGGGCSADGAGSSSSAANPMAKLADAILGSGKAPEAQYRDIPGVHGGQQAGPSGLRAATSAPQDSTAAALGLVQQSGPQPQGHVPGPRWEGMPSVAFQQGFDQAFNDAASLSNLSEASETVLNNFLHSFISAGPSHSPFLPVQLPDLGLDPAAKQRIRDRCSIMARHLFAEEGDMFVDQQVSALLSSLKIEAAPEVPVEGPQGMPPGESEWANAFQEQQHLEQAHMEHMHMQAQAEAGWAAEFEQQARLAAGPAPAEAWGDEFAGATAKAEAWGDEFGQQQLPQGHPPVAMGAGPGQCPALAKMGGPAGAWAGEFAAQMHPYRELAGSAPEQWAAEFHQAQPLPQQWAAEFAQQHPTPAQWVDEFTGASVSAADAAEKETGKAAGGAAAGESTKALVDTLSSDPDPKFQNSQFLKFVSKMSRGEITFEGNQVREGPSSDWASEFADQQPSTSSGGAAWATEFDAAQRMAQMPLPERWADEFEQSKGQEWAEEFAGSAGMEQSWQEMFAAQNQEMQGWLDEFQRSEEEAAGPKEYVFAPNNPYLNHENPGAAAKELFKQGLLSEAVLAIEADLQKHGDSCEMWRLLGTVHAENDDDQQAIIAMMNALKADPQNLEVLLSLGVSHTNELDQDEALSYLKQWLENNPKYADVVPPAPGPPSGMLDAQVIDMFLKAADANPVDADVHTVLGVLYNLTRDYDRAVESFRAALERRAADYSLWNKLGATLANSSRSGEALSAYRNALDIKPNYVRAWSNMGIGYANQGQYEESIRYYVRALAMNPRAMNIWGYLRISCSCVGRTDLTEAVDNHNLELLEKEFPLE